jgi:tRNA nucleotidyltransferase (CCA-adding enzyme)
LPEIDNLFGVPNPPKYHPEIDSGVHTLMVVRAAVELSPEPIVVFAALLHDLGKALTLKSKWPLHHGHEEASLSVISGLCKRLKIPADYSQLAQLASRFHLNIHSLSELLPTTIVKIFEKTDAFRRMARFKQLLLVCEADAQGTGKKIDYSQANHWQILLDECLKISAKSLIEEGCHGEEIKIGLHEQRVACVERMIKHWKKNEK